MNKQIESGMKNVLVPRLLDRGRNERGGVQRASASLPDLRSVPGKGLHCGNLHFNPVVFS